MQDYGKTLNVQAVTTNLGSCHFWRWLQGRLSEKLAQKKKLGELKFTEWWYQWLGQALLIMVERSVVLA